MKKYFLLLILLSGGLYSRSQDLDEIKKLVVLTQYDKAKTAIDKYLSDARNAGRAEIWYYKAFTCSNLSRATGKTVTESKSLGQEAYAALKKYMEMDSKAPLTKEESNRTLYNLYYGFYDLGVKMYNDKYFPESYELFKTALDIHDYTFAANLNGPNSLKFASHDTDVVWNLAILASELKKTDEIMTYFQRIADADLGDEKYSEAYDELIKKYKKEDNKELFNKYLDKAKKHYGTDPYWELIGIEFALKGLQGLALFSKYEELMLAYPNNYMVFFNYGQDLDKFVYSDDSRGKDISVYKKKIPELYKKAIAINSTVEANVLLASFYYSNSYDLIDSAQKIKSLKPDDVKKKNELLAQSKSTLSLAIPRGEEALKFYAAKEKDLKASEKVNYKLVLDILNAAYKQNGDAKKAAEYEKKKEEVDKL